MNNRSVFEITFHAAGLHNNGTLMHCANRSTYVPCHRLRRVYKASSMPYILGSMCAFCGTHGEVCVSLVFFFLALPMMVATRKFRGFFSPRDHRRTPTETAFFVVRLIFVLFLIFKTLPYRPLMSSVCNSGLRIILEINPFVYFTLLICLLTARHTV